MRLFTRLFSGWSIELIAIRDARSLAEAYNRGVRSSKGDVIILSHDDIDIAASDFACRLVRHLRQFDVVGVIGSTKMSGPAWGWSGHPHLRGWITHVVPEGDAWHAEIVDPRPSAGEIQVLDGVLLAARRKVFMEVDFDEKTFEGFHLYDIDWSYRAFRAGYRLAAAGDLQVVHASRGRFGAEWLKYANRFCAKFALERISQMRAGQLVDTTFATLDEVRAFFGILTLMNDEGPEFGRDRSEPI